MYRKNGTNSATKVYNWENALIKEYGSTKSTQEFNLKQSKSYASKIWNTYKNKFFKVFDTKSIYCSSVMVKQGYGSTASAFSGFYRHKRNRFTTSGLPIYSRKLILPNWAQNKPVILHEVAHLLNQRGEEHGENFMGVYMYLLNKHCGYNYKRMIQTANEVDLNFSFRRSPTLYKKVSPILYS